MLLVPSTSARARSYAPLGDQAVYPSLHADAAGRLLHGASKYILHFEAGGEPAALFWTLVLYAADTGREVSRLKDRPYRGADGSLTIMIQHEPPGAQDCNWLAAPSGCFTLTMRFYGPQSAILNGSWRQPAVTRVV